ncbi:hypothetical protein EVAR_3078_1 [Eumeta japonica]|uniref:Uncharacterized protein n=1 Tax=Eumeta variegata TaxID=151549 RepID=A0A4C1STW3_EUMVA|nr:hypothetical protein EVAR_3078_1 [Eumeta japonica]
MSCLSNASYAPDNHVILVPSACGLQEMKKIESRINAVKIRSLRSVCGVSQKDRCRNSDVRQRCGLKEDVVIRVERGMLRWFGQQERMNESGLTKQIYRANVRDGKVGKGRLENPTQTMLVAY